MEVRELCLCCSRGRLFRVVVRVTSASGDDGDDSEGDVAAADDEDVPAEPVDEEEEDDGQAPGEGLCAFVAFAHTAGTA